MPNVETPLWPNEEHFFFGKAGVAGVTYIQQVRGKYSCVPTCLAMLVQMNGYKPKNGAADRIADGDVAKAIADDRAINTQDPRTWSEELIRHGMKLAQLPTDIRPLELYLDELAGYEDLFLLSYYTGTRKQILATTKVEAKCAAVEAAKEAATKVARKKEGDAAAKEAGERAKNKEEEKPEKDFYQAGPSHVVLLYGTKIYDPHPHFAKGAFAQGVETGNYVAVKQQYYTDRGRDVALYTKRLFRVVPKDHSRGL